MTRAVRTALAAGAAVLTVGVVAGAALGLVGGGSAATPQAGPSAATEPVTRTTLTQTKQVNGVLGYGAPVPVTGPGQGTVTWLPAPGATVRRGGTLYKVDNHPVPLFYGGLPLYRPLRTGDTGDDVREVEANLAALGYTGLTVDRRYTAATAAVVRRWQKHLGLTQSGQFDPGSVVLAPGVVRVASLAARPGAGAGGPVLAYTGTTRVVSVALDVVLRDMAATGQAARITLPSGATVDGRVAAVGTVATAAQDEQHPATIEVTVAVSDQSRLGALDQAPVIVELTAQRAENVLTVPVAALVALVEGGYGVQVVTGTTSRYVAVRLGMFANGRVEVSGDGIAEGTRVVVPS